MTEKKVKYVLTEEGIKQQSNYTIGQLLCGINSQTLTFDEIKLIFQGTQINDLADEDIKSQHAEITDNLPSLIELCINNGYIRVIQ